MFEECRTVGETNLSSGRKSPFFYDFDLLLPREAATYTEMLLKSVPMDVKRSISFVAAPAVGGVVPAFLVAFALSKPLVIVEKDGTLRGPSFSAGKYVIVDDVISSFKEVNRVRSAFPASSCVGALAYIFRGSGKDLGAQDIPAFYLERKEIEE